MEHLVPEPSGGAGTTSRRPIESKDVAVTPMNRYDAGRPGITAGGDDGGARQHRCGEPGSARTTWSGGHADGVITGEAARTACNSAGGRYRASQPARSAAGIGLAWNHP